MRLTACSVPELEKNAKIERIEKGKTRHNCQICSVHVYHMLFDFGSLFQNFCLNSHKTLACVHYITCVFIRIHIFF